ncbi:MAG: hypothetical protein PHX90_04630 [Thermotogota bacterium]|nr:hypothetical protein [Thermotogota bacterium]
MSVLIGGHCAGETGGFGNLGITERLSAIVLPMIPGMMKTT